MRRRTPGRKAWRKRLQSFAAAGATLCSFPSASGWAAVSLDGSNCIIFGGQVKRELAVCVAWEGEGRTLSISLVGQAPNQVDRIVLRRDGADPFQTLHLEAEPPINLGNVGVFYKDMNFDGHGDLGIMRRGHTAVRQPFFYFLYDAHLKRFERSSALEGLDGLTFDSDQKHVVSRWRDGARRYKDSYAWFGDSLRLMEREQRGGSNAKCELIDYAWAGNQRRVRSTRRCW